MHINFDQLLELYNDYKKYLKRVEKYKRIKIELNDHVIPLFVELGELLNEFPTKFKYWRRSATDNKQKGLEEFADCLNFIFGQMTCNDINYIGSKLDLIDTLCMNDNNPNYFSHTIYEIMHFSFKDKNVVYQFYNLMIIGNKLGLKIFINLQKIKLKL